MNEIIIKSCESENKLIFSNKVGEYFDVAYASPSIQVKRTVWAYEDFPFLIGFFQKIATKWKGWDNEIEWKSVEGELTLTATSDSLGHAFLSIGFHQYDESETWTTTVKLIIETNQASDIVSGLRNLSD